MTANNPLERLKRGMVDLHVEGELVERLKKGKPLKIKAGFDPTRPDLHLGHTVLLRKMREFQELGHQVVFVVGDFTAQIGDPSGRNATRPALSKEEIRQAAATYAQQAFKVLDPQSTQVVFNSEWLEPMRFEDVIRLAGRYTLARMMERDDFKKRAAEHVPISIHELLYPLVQGYDSIVLECDVELGGTDQLFNLLVGRELMREVGLPPQVVMTTPILEGLSARFENGKLVGEKMSKSLNNYVGVQEPPLEQLGKLMSISDELMWRYYELLSALPESQINERKTACTQGTLNPRDAKLMLATELVARFHGSEQAEHAKQAWQEQFSARKPPQDMKEWTHQGPALLVAALAQSGVLPSTSEARRRIQQGAVKVDGERIDNPQHALEPREMSYEIKAGKRDWLRATITHSLRNV